MKEAEEKFNLAIKHSNYTFDNAYNNLGQLIYGWAKLYYLQFNKDCYIQKLKEAKEKFKKSIHCNEYNKYAWYQSGLMSLFLR